VDETSQFSGELKLAERFHAQKLFSAISNPAVLTVTAREDNAYKGVHLQRSVYMVQLPGGRKIIVDIFNAESGEAHQYDLPFQYSGQFIHTSFQYSANTKKQETLGTKNGYQFLWKEAAANVADTTVQFTFLNGNTYYTVSSLISDTAQLFFTRTGASDPNFNLRHEPAFIIRKKGKSQAFVNVIELHGKYDPVNEFSSSSYPAVGQIKLVQNDADFTIASIIVGGKKLMVAQCNKDFDRNSKHTLKIGTETIEWNGPYSVLYQGTRLQ
jgi:oligo-alginate lyase